MTHVATGLGLERFLCILQKKRSVFEIETMQPLFAAIQKVSGVPCQEENVTAYRVVADHVKTCAFAFSDDAAPVFSSHSYATDRRRTLVKHLLRSAVRYARMQLRAPSTGCLVALSDVVIRHFCGAFPEMKKNAAKIMVWHFCMTFPLIYFFGD